MRLFVAIGLPEEAAQALLALQGGVPGARWQTRGQLHLTLRFVGEMDGAAMNDIDETLSAIRQPPFSLHLKGVGVFGGKTPHSLWVGVEDTAPLLRLNGKIENVCRRLGLTPDTRAFFPHITIARLKHPNRDRLTRYLAGNALFDGPRFAATTFALYSSSPTSSGSRYDIKSVYDLLPSDQQ